MGLRGQLYDIKSSLSIVHRFSKFNRFPCDSLTKVPQVRATVHVCQRSCFVPAPRTIFKGACCLEIWDISASMSPRFAVHAQSLISTRGTHRWSNPGITGSRPGTSRHSMSNAQFEASTSPQTTEDETGSYHKWPNGGGMVHRDAVVDSTAVVEVGAVVHADARIAASSSVGAGSVVGPGVCIGKSTRLMYNVSLQNCSIGDDCLFHNGVSVGQDGFGFTVNSKGEMVKKPQELQVVIGNYVEIGANSCVDRGSWRDTQIGDHTKIDNLVQIGHNVVIGRCCILCGQVGLGGSSTLGDYVVLGGKAGVADHVSITSKVRIAAKSGVMADITEAGDYSGFPAVPAAEWRRSAVAIRKLGRR